MAAAAQRREMLLQDVKMIEEAARMAGAELAPYILQVVTRKKGMKQVSQECHYSLSQLYRIRRRFFYILRGLKHEEVLTKKTLKTPKSLEG